MLKQTRNALIYSDLALFVMDTREGLTYNDVALYKWLNYHKMHLSTDQNPTVGPIDMISEEERYKQILEEEEKYKKALDLTKGGSVVSDEMQDGIGKTKQEFDKKKFLKDKREKEFQKQFKNIEDQILLNKDIKVPEILYLANKSENGYEGDLLSDFYTMFPNIENEVDGDGNPVEPIFISAEHGDGLPDLF